MIPHGIVNISFIYDIRVTSQVKFNQRAFRGVYFLHPLRINQDINGILPHASPDSKTAHGFRFKTRHSRQNLKHPALFSLHLFLIQLHFQFKGIMREIHIFRQIRSRLPNRIKADTQINRSCKQQKQHDTPDIFTHSYNYPSCSAQIMLCIENYSLIYLYSFRSTNPPSMLISALSTIIPTRCSWLVSPKFPEPASSQ